MNDTERSQWIENDEDLYLAWRASRLSKREYIRKCRAVLDGHIEAVLHPNHRPRML